jgi:glycosyltransferase involved in cell wall biosynthesis
MQEVEDAIKQYKAAANKIGHAQPVLSYIYHGTDTDSFSIAAVNKTRQQLTTELFAVPDAANSIFILNANRYNERKDIASTITAFAAAVPLFNRRAYLCLHTPNLQTELEAQLRSQIASSDYKESILLNPLGPGYCSNEQLAGLYIACDIGINTSHGEGWGMISFEHAACGAAQLVPGYTSPGELWKDIAVLLPAQKSIQLSTNPFLMCCVNTGVLTDKLVQLVNNETYRNTISANCKQHVHNDIFNWKIIAAQWAEKLSCGKEGKIINMYQ